MKPGAPMDERKDFLGRGWAMPVALDPRTGLVAFAEYEDDIRQSILIILETAPGERVMRPNFGCGIHDLVFTSLDSTTLQRIRSEVEEALRRYEARIEVIGVTVDEAATSEGKLLVEVEYRVRKTNQVGNLVFPFYFREGGRP
jgi:phage baseplate assembly protein W